MVITDIKTYIVGAGHDNWVFLKVFTDEGITGLGECSVEGREHTVVKAIEEIIPDYIGKDPFDSGVLMYKCNRDGYWGSCAILSGALSAIDSALWDIKGKALNLPVHKLLGGAFKPKIRAYANRWFFGGDTPDKLAKLACATVEQGFTALKWDPFAKCELNISRQQLICAIEHIRAVRDAVGEEIDLLIEGHGRFNIRTAVQISNEIAKFHPMFFEEPIMPENIDALAQVKAKSPVAIAAGERMYSKYDFADAIRHNAVDYIQPDVRLCGGITEMQYIGALAQSAFLSIAPHNIHGLIGTAATIQVAATMSNTTILEFSIEETALINELFQTDICLKNGYIEIPKAPGLGIELNEEKALQMPYIRHSMIEKMFD